ncbi:PKD domain-containing protein, partial [Flavobacteriales bacterium]|nr:PKD domain-containing protein [Flavobacteriales bacterium]
VTLEIYLFPSAPVATNEVACEGGMIPDLTASGTTLTWYSDAALTLVVGNGPTFATGQTTVGVYTYYVSETDINGCESPATAVTLEIYPRPIPIISAIGPTQVCSGVDVVIELDSVYDLYLWNDGSSNAEFVANSTGDYSVVVTNSFGCTNNSNIVHIDVQNIVFADFYFDGLCVNDSTYFISNSYSVSSVINLLRWDFSNGFISYKDSVSFMYNLPGDYEVSLFVETDIGCNDSITKIVSIFGNPEADFTYSPFIASTLYPELTFINTSINGSPFLWEFGDSISSSLENPSHIYENPGVYDVLLIVKDLNDCVDSTIKEVIVYYDFVLHVPTAFTPNDDNDNDVFGPQGLRMEKYKSYEFLIYNKWGQILFRTTDINESWDGADFPTEVYNWLLIITDELGRVRKENGLVTLIR